MNLHNLPSQSWQINTVWMLAAHLSPVLNAWTRLLTLHNNKNLADAKPNTVRFRLYHLPAYLARHRPPPLPAHRADLALGKAFTVCWKRFTQLPTVT
ncbi:hypothetical protein ACFWH4_16035 [Streptomyces sp. NPDC127091]|uniref:hypothetical protein n=1 Tax=Streptomyces sp. NPDC127091 TaxID=3347134 RepID=UPI00364ED6A6